MSRVAGNGVLFDLDGVLFDTEPIHRKAWLETMRGFGYEIEEESLLPWTGVPCIDLARHYERTLEPRRDPEVYHRAKGRRFREIAERELRPFPGVVEAVTRIAARCPVGHVTSNDRIDADLMLRVAGLSELLPVGVAYEDVERHKPAPDPYLTAARLLGVEADHCIVVEDSPSGVAAAAAAEMTVAAVTTTFTADRLPDATRSFTDTPTACDWVLRLLSNGSR